MGGVATQAFANPRYGPIALALMGKLSPEEALDVLQAHDPLREERQVGIVSANGEATTFTGEDCLDWAGGLTGKGYAVQGNILAGEEVVQDMARAFESAEGVLAQRLLAALEAGQAAGGDKRGRQSAALLVVREGWGYGGVNDRFRDVRVDDHPAPIQELRRVYRLHVGLFPRPDGRALGEGGEGDRERVKKAQEESTFQPEE